MIILGVESSCDETAIAILENGKTVLASVVESQDETHRAFGGVVPELASRNHIGKIYRLMKRALDQSGKTLDDLDGIAATYAPGLIGSLLVGLSFAKSLAFALGKPFVGIHHIEGHLAATFTEFDDPPYPAIGLVVSGGHTNLYAIPTRGQYRLMGQTQDDAAGEAFDKGAKMMGLGFPGGPMVDQKAQSGNPKAIRFPRSQMPHFDFSFSGLKTALSLWVQKNGTPNLPDLAASYQEAIVDMLWSKTALAVQSTGAQSLLVCGGVARNSRLRARFSEESSQTNLTLLIPSSSLCTDNAVMIASAGYEKLRQGKRDPWSLVPKATCPI